MQYNFFALYITMYVAIINFYGAYNFHFSLIPLTNITFTSIIEHKFNVEVCYGTDIKR